MSTAVALMVASKPPVSGGAPVIPAAGLIAHWKLNDGSGLDMSGSGHNATGYGGVTPIIDEPMDNAVSFDGGSFTVIASNDVILIPYVSMSVWVRTTLAGAQIVSFSEGYASTAASDKVLFIGGDGKLNWYVYVGSASTAVATVPITDGTWHHVVGTYKEGAQIIYFDGVAVSSLPTTGPSYTSYTQIDVMMGGRGGTYGTTSFSGSQADFLLYDRALTATEVTSIYNVVASLPTAPTSWMMTAFTPGSPDRNDFSGEVGLRFKPTSNLTVRWLSTANIASNSGLHKVSLYDASGTLLRRASIDLTGKPATLHNWRAVAPITLTGGAYYFLMKETTNGDGQFWYEVGPTTMPLTSEIHSTYRFSGGSLTPVSIGNQYVGLDLGW